MSVCRAKRHWSAVAIRWATSLADALTSHTPIPKNISWLNCAFPVNVSLPQVSRNLHSLQCLSMWCVGMSEIVLPLPAYSTICLQVSSSSASTLYSAKRLSTPGTTGACICARVFWGLFILLVHPPAQMQALLSRWKDLNAEAVALLQVFCVYCDASNEING
eukprot:3425402-Rhodomonas_salina.2